MIQRGGAVLMPRVETVQHVTIKPWMTSMISPGSCLYPDEDDSYARLEPWGYTHQRVCHGTGAYARDDDGEGFHEVHVHTMEGFWSL